MELVIGPPGCGKSTYCAQRRTIDPKLTVYDDFLKDNITSSIWKDLKDGKRIIANDPRLCNPMTFSIVIKKVKKIVGKKNIMLLLFDTSIEQCTKNIKKRMKNGDNRDTLGSLNDFFDMYKMDTYKGYRQKIIHCKKN
jgi:adenylate kinase family enzyme